MLKNYASDYRNSKGRFHKEEDSKNRNPFQRDRDRVIHSQSFRRLEYKTQVFVNYESDHFRTRLTHSLEVAQISRAITKKLGLDQDLSEALALAHDIGHPPFGHAGEAALNDVMKKYDGFDHNAQALKILTRLEDPYADFDGLNLTFETLEGLVKHNGPIKGLRTPKIILDYNKKHNLDLKRFSSLEAQVAAISDDIAYNNHDIDDGMRAGLLKEEDLMHVDIIANAFKHIDQKYPNLASHKRLHEVRRIIYSAMVDDVISQTEQNIAELNIISLEDVRNAKQTIACFSAKVLDQVIELKRILRNKVYTHPRVQIMNRKAYTIISELFTFYMDNNDCIPVAIAERFHSKSNKKDKARVICDYIAGMTDRFAIQRHQKVFDLYSLNQSFK